LKINSVYSNPKTGYYLFHQSNSYWAKLEPMRKDNSRTASHIRLKLKKDLPISSFLTL